MAYKRFPCLIFLCVLTVTISHGLSSPAVAEEVLQITASSGAKLRTLLTGNPKTARANVILLTGGNGVLIISGKGEIKKPTDNFLVRTRQLFAKAGFLAAVVDAPMDRRKDPGLLGGFRASSEHGNDLAKVARKMNALNGKPVIAIGTSRGTVSAANLALSDTNAIVVAAVLTASIVKPNDRGKTIKDLPLNTLRVPVLFVHNKGDKCKTTLLADVKPVLKGLKNKGVKADLIVVSSTKKTGDHCDGSSPHGFFRLEQRVIDKIIGWIDPML